MLQAGRPTLATTPSGKMIILSSPHARTGELWSLREKHYGRDDSPTLIWQASSDFMNPTLGKDYLERMRLEDPEGYLSEFGGEFRSGLSTFLDSESIQACVATGVRERTRIEGVQYVCFIDPSGGRHDSFVAAVAHDNNGRAVLDAIRIFQSPFNPTSVIAEICQFLKGD